MTRRRGAYCADDTEEYIKIAIENEHIVSPFYDDIRKRPPCVSTFQGFDFSVDKKQLYLDENDEDTPTDSPQKVVKVLVVDSHPNFKSQTQMYCGETVTAASDEATDYVNDFYVNDVSKDLKVQLWLQNYKTTKYEALKNIYLQKFKYFVVLERGKTRTSQIIDKITRMNTNYEKIFKLRVRPLAKNNGILNLDEKIVTVSCVSVCDGLKKIEYLY